MTFLMPRMQRMQRAISTVTVRLAMVKTCPGSAAPSTWNRGAWKMPWKMACRKKSGKL